MPNLRLFAIFMLLQIKIKWLRMSLLNCTKTHNPIHLLEYKIFTKRKCMWHAEQTLYLFTQFKIKLPWLFFLDTPTKKKRGRKCPNDWNVLMEKDLLRFSRHHAEARRGLDDRFYVMARCAPRHVPAFREFQSVDSHQNYQTKWPSDLGDYVQSSALNSLIHTNHLDVTQHTYNIGVSIYTG